MRKVHRSDLLEAVVLVALISGIVTPSVAADLRISADISEFGVWDTNPLMRTRDPDEIYGSVTTPSITFSTKTEASLAKLTASVDQNLFSDSDYNSTDFHGNTVLKTQTRRFEAGLTARGDYDTTRTSELTNVGLDTKSTRRTGYEFGPSFGYRLSPISKITLNGNYAASIYDDVSHVNYHTLSVTPSYMRNFTELYSGIFSVKARRYETDEGLDRVVDSVGPSIGVIAKLTEKATAQVSVGEEATREKQAGEVVQDWSWDYVFAGSLSFKGDQDVMQLSAARAQQSYANGSDRLLTTFSLKNDHAINQSLSINYGASYQYADTNETSSSSELEEMYIGNAGVVYHAFEKVDLVTSYRYRNESLTGTEKVARQNIVRIGMTYRPNLVGAGR